MNKKRKIIISVVLCIVIILIGLLLVLKNKSAMGEKESKYFIKSISYIKEENYSKAYNNIKESPNKKEKEIIQTIIFYIFGKELEKSIELNTKITDEAENITNYLTYTYIYSKDSSYQEKIDKMYDEEYVKLYLIKDKISSDILFDDCADYYNLYFEYIDLQNGLFKNYEYNILNNKDEIVSKLTQMSSKLMKLNEAYEKSVGLHPERIIPEQYRYLLNI